MTSKSYKLKCLAVEPYYGGSHANFIDNLINYSNHKWHKLTLPAFHWKWRMRIGAYLLSEKIQKNENYDILFVSDYLDLACFLGLTKSHFEQTTKIIYFHENQLTYPLGISNSRDYHFVITHLTSIHCSNEIWFNSNWHRRDFFTALKTFTKIFPEKKNKEIINFKNTYSKILPLGINNPLIFKTEPRSPILSILWNHRWEQDKNPELFYNILKKIKANKVQFNLVLLGKRDNKNSKYYTLVRSHFKEEIIFDSWIENKKDYFTALKKCDIVVSTSIHEFFGLSMLEAICSGCFPILPNSLSYPEIIPKKFHPYFLYDNDKDLLTKLESILLNITDTQITILNKLIKELEKYSWQKIIQIYDQEFLTAKKHLKM